MQCKGPEAGLGGGSENGTPCLDLGTGTRVPSAISSAPPGAVLSVYESEGGNRSSSVSLEQRKLRTEETPTHQPLAREGESKQQLTACNSPRPSVELGEARGHAPGTPKDGAHELLRSAQVGRAGTEPARPPPPACWLLPHSKKTPGRRYAHPSEGPGAAGNAGLDCGGRGGGAAEHWERGCPASFHLR